jgi:hypothetical protein
MLFQPKTCPKCKGVCDIFDTCTKCGRPWSEKLEIDELPPEEQDAAKEQQTFVKSVGDLQQINPAFNEWQIDAENDSATEIIRKRSLMRLDSRKTYTEMGLAVRAHEQCANALLSFSRLWDFLDDEERDAFGPTLERLKSAMTDLTEVRTAKINKARDMEKALEKASRSARKARVRLESWKARQAKTVTTPGQDSEGKATIVPVELNPDELLAQAEERLLALEERRREKESENPE